MWLPSKPVTPEHPTCFSHHLVNDVGNGCEGHRRLTVEAVLHGIKMSSWLLSVVSEDGARQDRQLLKDSFSVFQGEREREKL